MFEIFRKILGKLETINFYKIMAHDGGDYGQIELDKDQIIMYYRQHRVLEEVFTLHPPDMHRSKQK